MRESLGCNTQRQNESEGQFSWLTWDPLVSRGAPWSHPYCIVSGVEIERTRWDPKDGELCLSRMRPEETLVEVHSDSDVQIDRRTWV